MVTDSRIYANQIVFELKKKLTSNNTTYVTGVGHNGKGDFSSCSATSTHDSEINELHKREKTLP